LIYLKSEERWMIIQLKEKKTQFPRDENLFQIPSLGQDLADRSYFPLDMIIPITNIATLIITGVQLAVLTAISIPNNLKLSES
jgi:hypothetical protein